MPESARQLMDEALALLIDDEISEGVDRLRRAVETDRDCAEAWGHLSWQLAVGGRHDESLQCVEQVLRIQAENTEARWRRADRLVRLERLDEAEAQYRAVLVDHADCHDARTGLRWIEWMRKKGRTEDEGPTTRNQGGKTEEGGGERAARKRENQDRSAEHFERRDLRLRSLPYSLEIESSTRCNAACITCNRGHDPYYAEDLRPEVFELIERVLLPTATQINLTGYGEPLLARRFDHFHQETDRCGAAVYLVTNGILLTMARLERFARHRTDLVVSIDGARPETVESIRRGVRFDRLIESLRLYKKIRELYPEVRSKLGVNFVGLRRNIEELSDLVDLAAELGAAFVNLLDFVVGLGLPELHREHLSHCPDLANRMFDEAAGRARRRGIALYLPSKFGAHVVPPGASLFERLRRARRFLPERRRFPLMCSDPWSKVLVSTAGLVHPCCASRRVMGDLTRQDVVSIWNGRRYRWFRRRIRSFFPPPECRICSQHWGINAGNPMEVRRREGILVKALYLAEARWLRLLARVRRIFVPPPPPPEPNYCEGRPIRRQEQTTDSGAREVAPALTDNAKRTTDNG